MSRIKDLLFALAFVCLASNIFGQAALGITASGLQITPDPIDYPMDSVAIFKFAVENKGNAAFTGTIFIYAKYNDDPTPYVIDNVVATNFLPNDSISFEVNDDITGIKYKGGDNIIVIWPGADNIFVQTVDSSSKSVLVSGLPLLTGIFDSDPINERLKIYPNPVKSSLNLRLLTQKHELEYVRIADLEGREVFFSHEPVMAIDLSAISQGVYLLQARFKDGLKGNFKLIKLK